MFDVQDEHHTDNNSNHLKALSDHARMSSFLSSVDLDLHALWDYAMYCTCPRKEDVPRFLLCNFVNERDCQVLGQRVSPTQQ